MQQQTRFQDAAFVEQLARALGWFSLGLGAAEMLWPRRVASVIGVPADRGTVATIRAMGGREVLAGVAVLAAPTRPGPLWNRVAGDAIDLSLLGAANRAEHGLDRARLIGSIAAVAGVTAADVVCAVRLTRSRDREAGRAIRVEYTTTINRSIEEVYRFWRNFENLPSFMRHLESVRVLTGGRSHWRASTPVGMTLEWDAEIVRDSENEIIEWRSVEGSAVQHRGSVRFSPAPGARGTEVRIEMEYEPPGGAVGRAVARLLSEIPEQQLREDLRRFKQIMEAGEVSLSDGPGLSRAAQPARPADVRELAGVRA